MTNGNSTGNRKEVLGLGLWKPLLFDCLLLIYIMQNEQEMGGANQPSLEPLFKLNLYLVIQHYSNQTILRFEAQDNRHHVILRSLSDVGLI
ncbi:hypothetical protein F2Q69_00002495 [Brassica cretica]|uniref:Uncharacterized protein n=1 Tax=Brassica cretica TaxID=69181 RepID=A0A8S9PDK5_BRACR|nr:hypothetical protein F2Q69_00002495 [Brassica cretica]